MTELWYRLNILGEKKFFEKEHLIDGLIVPAHLIAYYELALPEFLSKLNLPILIDPMTYVWGIEPHYILKDGELKKSYKKLVKKLDCTIAKILGVQRIQSIKADSPGFNEFINKVLKFQLLDEDTEKTPRKRSMERIKSYGETVKTEEPNLFQPYALIPPYFHFETVLGPSYSKTVYAAKFAKNSDYGKKHRICPCLCMGKSILTDKDQIATVIEDFKDYPEIILWVDNFDETHADLSELTDFITLISKFKEAKTDVINLYGGYFSLILNRFGLSKLSCGICYSHRKEVSAAVGGGGLPIRYYEPHLKNKLTTADIIRLYSDIPELFTCNCTVCSTHSEKYRNVQSTTEKASILKDFFGESKKSAKMKGECKIDWTNSRFHFLYARKKEQKFSNKSTLDVIISDLREKYELLKNRVDLTPYRIDSFEYLKLWADSLEEKSEEIAKSS